MTLPPLVVFLLAAAIIAGSLSWPVVAGAAFGLAVLVEVAAAVRRPPLPPADDE